MTMLKVSRRRSAHTQSSRRRLSYISPAALLLLPGTGGNDVVATGGSSTPVDWSKFANDNEERMTQEIKGSNNEAVLIASESEDGVATRQRSLVDPQIYYYNNATATADATIVTPTAPPSPMPTHLSLKYIGNNGIPASSFPLGACEADCDTDDDCRGDLICFQRGFKSYKQVPGCLGGDENSSSADYCIRPDAKVVTAPPTSASPTISPVPTATPRIQYVGFNWKPFNRFPLDACSGDCNVDSDCKGDLICFQRDAYEHVPGCLGGDTERSRTDYCISPDAPIITAPPTTPEPTISPKPTPEPTPIPTKNPSGLLDYVQTKGKGSQNLNECEGDCDRNSDCVGDLVCLHREEGEPLPGCEGTPDSRTDFCIQPQYTYMPTPRPTKYPTMPPTRRPTPSPTAQPTFIPIPNGTEPARIKMYWQDGFKWQDKKDQEWYCLQCRNPGWDKRKGCNVGQKIEIDDCRRRRLRQQFVRVETDKTIRPALDSDLCFTHQNRADDIYLDFLTVEYCNGSEQQRFYIVGTPWQKNGKFEIRTSLRSHKQQTCLTNPHHPRPYEHILPQRCDRARMHETASWTVY